MVEYYDIASIGFQMQHNQVAEQYGSFINAKYCFHYTVVFDIDDDTQFIEDHGH